MSAKKQRLSVIEHILHTEIVRSQNDLRKSLMDRGFEVAQATLSRDIRELQMIKTPDQSGYYRYILPDMDTKESRKTMPLFGVLSVEFSGNLAVTKTRPGFAMGIASFIDEQAPEEILGTIAGDDTILVIPREGFSKSQVNETLIRLFNR